MLGAPWSRSADGRTGASRPWRPVVAQVADKFLARGIPVRGFARIR
jgi:hypothetical protein